MNPFKRKTLEIKLRGKNKYRNVNVLTIIDIITIHLHNNVMISITK